MKIALTNPTTWPRVRRGAERFLNELAAYLGSKGHEVTVISGKPGRQEVVPGNGYTTVLHRRLWHPALARIGWLEFHSFLLTVLGSLLWTRYDAVLCCTFVDAYAARLARRFNKVPCVLWVNGLPPKVRYFRSLSLGGAVFKRAVQGSDAVIAFSGFVEQYIQDRWGRTCVRIPVPVDTDRFRLVRERDHQHPVIVCASALDDRRKGARLLVRAFDRLKSRRPQARLQFAYPADSETCRQLAELVSPQWRSDVQFLRERDEILPRIFGEAAVCVLPSMWEPFGMVILEAMATGTPVVGTRDGAIPELINSPGIGRLFDPGADSDVEPTNLDGLVQALDEALELSRRPETALKCRAHAEQFSWARLGPHFERLFEELAHVRGRRPVSWSGVLPHDGAKG